MDEQPAMTELIADELRLIRSNVPGARGGITATSDGLLIAQDMTGIEPTQIAALVAAMHAVASRASLSTECGQLREVITRGSDGYLAVYAAGGAAIVAVLGASDMNVALLNLQARKMIDRIAEHAASLTRRPQPGPAAPAAVSAAEPGSPGAPGAPGQLDDGAAGGGEGAAPLPARRPDGG
jgi:hypothetical protein